MSTPERLFGEHLPRAREFAGMLSRSGVERGLIGPREVDRLWDRHVLNCGLLLDALPAQARTVADIGSGAGLPGVVVAIARPDLQVTLVETMLRRTDWLREVARDLNLENVEVVRSRAEDLHGQRTFDVVTARAVAALGKLAGWTLPLVADGGQLLAMKGSSAAAEIEDAADVIARLGGVDPQVLALGEGEVEVPTTVVRVQIGEREATAGTRSGSRGPSGGAGARRRRPDRTTTRGAHHGRRPR